MRSRILIIILFTNKHDKTCFVFFFFFVFGVCVIVFKDTFVQHIFDFIAVVVKCYVAAVERLPVLHDRGIPGRHLTFYTSRINVASTLMRLCINDMTLHRR